MSNPAQVVVYSKSTCPFCRRASALLNGKGVAFTEIEIAGDSAKREEMIARSGRTTVPQVFVGGVHVGGSDELQSAEDSGRLDDLLSQAAAGNHK